ncbi:MAG TPA: phosphate ABC transporter substrate-binding protein PstS [Nitrososphaera sp.]|nr:phosphate ABC transporter substrate-binding protein PstS [Nitrososphaera sp.]
MRTTDKVTMAIVAISAATLLVFASVIGAANHASAQSPTTLNGAGATFPYPLIDTWRIEYSTDNPRVNINYQSIGSGGGIKQFTEKTVDFGASDAPMTQVQRQLLDGTVVHIPETIGSIAAVYNIPEVPSKGLKLTGGVLSSIFLGKITKWDDPQIKQLNPDLQLPSTDITVVHRSDGSGTTFVWTSYLSMVSQEWNDTVGKGTAVQWVTGIGSPGNEGVANSVKTTPYAIGYVELAYALTTKMPYAYLQNHDKSNFVEPSLESTRQAVESLSTILPAGEESWESVSLLDAPGNNSYPIASFSYILLYKDLSTNPGVSKEEAEALVRFVSWAVTDGQQYSERLSYVPLPQTVVDHNLKTLRGLTYEETSLATAVVPEFPIMAVLILAPVLISVMAVQRMHRAR